MAINKLVLFGIDKRALELKVAGKTNAEISRILTDECGKPITQMSVGRFFQAEHEALTEAVSKAVHKNEALKEEAARQCFDLNQALLYFLWDIKAAIQECKKKDVSPEKRAKLYNVALKDLEIMSKRLGEITDQPTQIVINVTRIREAGS
jgi:hypothetical protein